MAKDSRNRSSDEGPSTEEATSLGTVSRRRARGLIDAIVEEELEAMLGAAPSAPVGILRQGYRHRTRERTVTVDGLLICGLTAHTLPLTRDEVSEVFIYDIAVVPDWQRHGVGRQLISTLRSQAAGRVSRSCSSRPTTKTRTHSTFIRPLAACRHR
jgi:ribosomal protein S18 acetylase RimI-like enzyme